MLKRGRKWGKSLNHDTSKEDGSERLETSFGGSLITLAAIEISWFDPGF